MFILIAFLKLVIAVLDIYSFFLMAWVIVSLLLYFGIINRFNRFVSTIGHFLDRIIEPALKRIRKFVPLFGTVDLSPLVLYLAIGFVRNVIIYGLANSMIF